MVGRRSIFGCGLGALLLEGKVPVSQFSVPPDNLPEGSDILIVGGSTMNMKMGSGSKASFQHGDWSYAARDGEVGYRTICARKERWWSMLTAGATTTDIMHQALRAHQEWMAGDRRSPYVSVVAWSANDFCHGNTYGFGGV